MRKNVGEICCLYVLILLIAVSCAKKQDIPLLDILQPDPCAPPCWQNITPGETRRGAAIQALLANPWVEQFAVVDRFSAIGFHGSVDGIIEFEDDVVKEIRLPLHAWYDNEAIARTIHIDDLVRLHGAPLVRTYPVSGPKSSWTLRRTIRYGIFIMYPAKGWQLMGNFEISVQSPAVPTEVTLFTVEYVDPNDYWELVGSAENCSIPWDGYREADYYCRVPCQTPEEADWACSPDAQLYWP